MIYALLATNLVALGLLGYVIREAFSRLDARETEHRDHISQLHQSHRQEIAQLNQARMEETAALLQRIQAPDQATASHAGQDAKPDPIPVPLDDDLEMFRVREERMKAFGLEPVAPDASQFWRSELTPDA